MGSSQQKKGKASLISESNNNGFVGEKAKRKEKSERNS